MANKVSFGPASKAIHAGMLAISTGKATTASGPVLKAVKDRWPGVEGKVYAAKLDNRKLPVDYAPGGGASWRSAWYSLTVNGYRHADRIADSKRAAEYRKVAPFANQMQGVPFVSVKGTTYLVISDEERKAATSRKRK